MIFETFSNYKYVPNLFKNSLTPLLLLVSVSESLSKSVALLEKEKIFR